MHLEQGLLNVQQGKLAAAVDAFRKVLEMDPNHGPTNRHWPRSICVRASTRARRSMPPGQRSWALPLAADKRKLLQDGLLKKKQEPQKKETEGRE